MRYPTIRQTLFEKNRQKAIQKFLPEALAIIHSADEIPRNADNLFPYRQNSDFFYLTGIEQEKSILILYPSHPKTEMREILFIIKPDKLLETWVGRKLTQEDASQISAIKTVMYLDDFEEVLKEFLTHAKTVYLNNRINPKIQQEIAFKEARFAKNIQEQFPHLQYETLAPILTACRLRKEFEEIELLKKAATITEKAFKYTVQHIKEGAKEYEIEAALMYSFLHEGASGGSFAPIVAAGKNALTLHYTQNDGSCRNGDLLLLDFGCEYANYASDCSVTLPVNGIFDARQKECYNAVLDVFEKAKKLFITGSCIDYINKQINQLLEEKMIALGLFTQKDVNHQDEKNPCFRKYYMHGASHFIGLDAHDVGDIHTPLEAGMVLSCEPGIYIAEENIGIRIETMLLITDGEPVDLLPNIPRTTEEIEKFTRDNNLN